MTGTRIVFEILLENNFNETFNSLI